MRLMENLILLFLLSYNGIRRKARAGMNVYIIPARIPTT